MPLNLRKTTLFAHFWANQKIVILMRMVNNSITVLDVSCKFQKILKNEENISWLVTPKTQKAWDNCDLVTFWRFFGTQISILSPIHVLLLNYMCFMLINHIKKVSCKNNEICSFKGRIIVKNSPHVHIWACVFLPIIQSFLIQTRFFLYTQETKSFRLSTIMTTLIEHYTGVLV